ncbi:MAG: c-type cytochrome [Verrucomicrobia bacterium]|nr:c-type cytochrome [Verrucomicrobiota bacterium]
MNALSALTLAASVALATAAQAAQTNLNGHAFTLPDGLTVELVAGASLVERPISIAFDERGRLYATDSSGSNEKGPTQYERKDHRIVRLEDTDGDGRFDKSVVFADKMMFPEGAMFYEGSLYVAAPPQVWKLTDTDGDGVADKREVWHDGKTLTGCANDLHGPYLGLDGWIYWTKGAFAEQRYTLPNGKPFVTRASHIFRARPDGTGIEPVLTGGMDNPVGVAFHSTGERFLSCTFVQPGGGKRDGLLHAIYGGVYGKEQSALDGHPRTGDLMPVMTHMGAAAPCGLTTYRSRVFGADWSDNLLACYFNLRKVVRHELIPDGATFKTKDTDLLASDHVDFHPTDVLEDADGSVLIVDTGGWYKICCPTSQLAKPDVLGGIYRLRKVGMPKPADPRGLKLNWPALKPADLAKLLADERLYVRQRAIHELGKRGESAVPALRHLLVGADVRSLTSNAERGRRKAERKLETPHVVTYGEDVRRDAVWSLSRITGPAAREAVRTALNDTDASVRHAAIHVASVWRDTNAAGRIQGVLTSSETTAAMRRTAAEALGRIGGSSAVAALISGAEHLAKLPEGDGRRMLEHSLTAALIEIGAASETAVGLTSPNASVQRVALLAMDQMPNSSLKADAFLPLRHSRQPALKQAAWWVIGHRPELGEYLARQFFGDLYTYGQSLPVPDAVESALRLSQLAKSPAIQTTLSELLKTTDTPKEARLIALRAMAASGLKETPTSWLKAVTDLLSDSNDELVRQAVATARTFSVPKQGNKALLTALQDLGESLFEQADIRLDALVAAGNTASMSGSQFAFLRTNLAPANPMMTRSAASTVLARAKLSAEQQLALAETMKGVSPLDAPRLLPVFEKSPTEELGLKLVASLKDSTGLRGLRVDLLKPLLAKYPKSVQDAGAELLTRLNEDAGKQRAHLESLLPTLKDGDVRRGHALFKSQKSACATCHAIGYLGGKLGPDLTRIGQVRTEMDLLESIIYPSASFVRSYEPFTVVQKGGEDFTGIVRKDAPDEVVLANGPETEARIARADVVEIRPGKVSLMPDGLEQALTRQELADLLAFLKAAK